MADGGVATVRSGTTELGAFLRELRASPRRGRLIFALDATASRQPTWDLTATLTSGMVREAATLGSLDLQLAYYRGDGECRASGWIQDPAQLTRLMSTIDCRSGPTQIGKIFTHALKETAQGKVGAVVFIGDALEQRKDAPNAHDDIDPLCSQARELGRLGTPVFMFQEGRDREAEAGFREIASLSGGAYERFDAGAGKRLGELLKAAALFAVGGTTALEGRKDAGARLLLGQLRGGS